MSGVLGLGLLISYAYFYQAGGWNQNSRFALVRAILERHTLQIDAYQAHTFDRAFWNGHYYSDKAPGASLLALVPVELARSAARAAGIDPGSFPGIAWTSYIAAVVTSGIFTVAAALAVLWLSLHWGSSPEAALFAATGYGLASPAWCYATLFMGHGLTAGCLMLAYAAAVALGNTEPDSDTGSNTQADSSTEHGVSARRGRRLAWAVGLTAGWAVVSEFQAAVPAGLIAGLALLNARGSTFLRVMARVAIGGLAAGSFVLAYDALAFGSPLHIGYASEQGFDQLRIGLFGITYPHWWRLREILVGSYRGLLPLAPLVAVAPVGLVRLGRGRGRRPAVLVAAMIALYYLLLNASYFYWEGGWSYGPRQLSPGLPFAALGLAPLWDGWRTIGRVLLAAGWLWGVALTLVAVSTTPQPPSNTSAPVRELLWPAFRDGDLSLNRQTMVHGIAVANQLRDPSVPRAAWNLGEIAGLHGKASLLPLGGVWALVALTLGALLRRTPEPDSPDPTRLAHPTHPNHTPQHLARHVALGTQHGTQGVARGTGHLRSPACPTRQFGNLEANLRFIDATGVVTSAAAVLEIGCGTGALLHTLIERGCRVQGVEINRDLIEEARRAFGALPIQRVEGVELPFPDESFDVAMSFDVFEHIPDSDGHLREVRRVLRPGGSYLMQTPNKWTNVVFETIRWRSFTRFREDHCSLHTLSALERRLSRLGFTGHAYDVPVVNAFFRDKIRQYLGAAGLVALSLVNPDRLPLGWRTNLFVQAIKINR